MLPGGFATDFKSSGRGGFRQSAESGDVYFFSPHGRFKPGLSNKSNRITAQCLETGAQHLAPLSKRGRRHLFQHRYISIRKRLGPRCNMHDGRRYLGRWCECLRGNIEHFYGIAAPLRNDRQTPIGIVSHAGANSMGHLFLKHQGQR